MNDEWEDLAFQWTRWEAWFEKVDILWPADPAFIVEYRWSEVNYTPDSLDPHVRLSRETMMISINGCLDRIMSYLDVDSAINYAEAIVQYPGLYRDIYARWLPKSRVCRGNWVKYPLQKHIRIQVAELYRYDTRYCKMQLCLCNYCIYS